MAAVPVAVGEGRQDERVVNMRGAGWRRDKNWTNAGRDTREGGRNSFERPKFPQDMDQEAFSARHTNQQPGNCKRGASQLEIRIQKRHDWI